ncbi:ATP-binding protein [Methylobacterium radiodurans]|nr:ATP-binding protein [Methylobacterium radiodurans]
MERVRAKFLETDRYDELVESFQEALDSLELRADPDADLGPGNRTEAKILMVLGETGAGKTRSLKRMFARHDAFPGYDRPRSNCPLVTIKVRAPTTFTGVGRQILQKLGYPIKGALDKTLVWERVQERIEMCGLLAIHLDEMHNVVLKANEIDRTDIQNALKSMVTDEAWPIVVIVSGLPVLADFLEEAEEDRRRALTVNFDALDPELDGEAIREMGKTLASVAGVVFSDTVAKPLVPRLLHAGLYQMGTSIELIQEAIGQALKAETDDLRREHFASAYYKRTACGAAANPFTVDAWQKIDCSRVLQKSAAPTTDKTPAERIKAHRNRMKGKP